MICEFVIPIKTVSETNRRDHWATRHRRVKAQKEATLLALLQHASGFREQFVSQPRMRVELVRIGARILDDDNLRGAFKAVRDAIAYWAKVDDGRDVWEWSYVQTTGKPPRVIVRLG